MKISSEEFNAILEGKQCQSKISIWMAPNKTTDYLGFRESSLLWNNSPKGNEGVRVK